VTLKGGCHWHCVFSSDDDGVWLWHVGVGVTHGAKSAAVSAIRSSSVRGGAPGGTSLPYWSCAGGGEVRASSAAPAMVGEVAPAMVGEVAPAASVGEAVRADISDGAAASGMVT
jgi:hypothetical protein